MRPKKISKEEVLSCASDIIKSEGLEACTIRSLAAYLNVAVGTIYNYFPSHEKLLQETFITSWSSTIEKLKQCVTTNNTPDERLTEFTKVIFEEVKNRKGLGSVVVSSQVGSLFGENAYTKIFDDLSGIIKDIIRDGKQNRDLNDDTLDMLSRWILVVIVSHIGSLKPLDENFTNELKKRFL